LWRGGFDGSDLDLLTDLSLVESDPHCGAEAPAGLSEESCKIWGNVLDKILTDFAKNPVNNYL